MAASGNEAMTIKQLKDYADNKQLKTGTMQEFCEYMEIPYIIPVVAADGVTITENRSTKNADMVHIEALIVVTRNTSGTLFTIPKSTAPKNQTQYIDKPDWGNASGGVGRYDTDVCLDVDGNVYIQGAVSTTDDVIGTVTFDYTI